MTQLPKNVLDLGLDEGTLDLLRTIYEEQDLEERSRALGTGFQWFNTLARPASNWVRSLLPLLSDSVDPLLPVLLDCLTQYDLELSRPEQSRQEDLLAMSSVIRNGYDRYLELFPVVPLSAARLLTNSPERAGEYVPAILSYWDVEPDPEKKASTILAAARVSFAIPNWRGRLLEGVQSGSRYVVFVCGMELARLDGDDVDPGIIDALVCASPGPEGRILFRTCARRTLPRLQRSTQIGLLIRLLEQGTATDECHWIARYLLGAVYGRITAISDSREMRFFEDQRSVTFTWVGPNRTHDLRSSIDSEQDWLAALLNATLLWQDDYPLSKGKEPKTNLYELFGLPGDRGGLVRLWNEEIGDRRRACRR